MIKKRILPLFFINLCAGINTYCSKSTLIPRTIVEDNTYTLLPLAVPEKKYSSFINIIPLYIRSTQSKKTGAYFLFGRNCMTIGDEDSNVAPEWFGLEAPVGQSIDSTLTLNPKRSTTGVLFFGGYKFTKDLFATISIPLVYVKHNLNMNEGRAGAYGFDPCIKTFTEALNQPCWCHGKFCPTAKTKTNIDDIGINIGYIFQKNFKFFWNIYAKGIIPTGKTPPSNYIFEPIVGSKHFGLGAGTSTNFNKPIHHSTITLNWFIILDYLYRFKGKEYRSFDLCNNGPWSRYLLLVNHTNTLDPLDGINILSPQVTVTPGHHLEFTTGLKFEKNMYAFSIGYDIWYRSNESIKICNNFASYGIFNTHETSEDGTTASTATINIPPRATTPDDSFISLKNLNICSGAQPTSINSKLFGGFTKILAQDEKKIIKVELWGSYEYAHKNSALSQWSIWGNIGFEF